MKILMQPVEMVARFSSDGNLRPVKYQIASEGEPMVIRVDQILFKTEEKLAGNRMLLFRCQSEINGFAKIFELKYELNTCKWFLYKM
ncbi:hypothetical protein [Desulfitobacterium metallireducens]|uniref:Uncharacterized protein n=1 Tax=Desulfitobacterium metallireducens DSM 15288 TaxID=871968 RepID=W0E9J2_9FIRM|nr:hypothetical protein [Desulfitobacterium metallireducens]AHF06173.1 hypothetical protein DESME_03230 [Desulfitobacterium metallireducens DSM 15288]